MSDVSYAELHSHTSFSFLDGASAPDDLVSRAVALALTGLAVTDHQGLYGAVRFVSAAEAAGLHPVVGIEVELVDPLVPDPAGVVIPPGRNRRRTFMATTKATVREGLPDRPRASRPGLPGHRRPVREDLRGVGERARGPHLVLLARDTSGYRSLCRLVSRANLAGTKGVPRFSRALLAAHAEGLVALSGCRDGEIARRLRVGDREGARAAAEWLAGRFRTPGDDLAAAGLALELQHHLLPADDWLVAETAALANELGLPVIVSNDVHYALPDDRELHDVLTGIRHGRSLDELGHLRRRDGESYLKSGAELAAMPPAHDPAVAPAWREGLANAVELAASCSVDLGFEQYRFPGFPVPDGETPFSHLSELCWSGVRRRYHPVTPAVMRQLAHELDVIDRTGLAEFFLICWDLMRFAKSRGIPAQGRGSAADSIVAYVLGITRVDPIRHNLLFERFINEGRTAYPDVDIDFSSERREEVIQYVYERYGEEHTGMVCNLVTYRARSAVREVGYALGFPRPLVDRVAKALETYDSVMVRRDLEADGGFAEFFRRPGEDEAVEAAAVEAAAALAGARGLTDAMGQLNHGRGGRMRTGGAGEAGNGRLPRREDTQRRGSGAAGAPGTGAPGTEPPGTEPPGTEPPGTERPSVEPPGTTTPISAAGASGGAYRLHHCSEREAGREGGDPGRLSDISGPGSDGSDAPDG
ncbi:MAG TPA: PHP domain-containing protein, partial [Vitreimonas sp.]|nr:PHP domain-containing protein [Vitreimonas sp.]